MVAATRSIAAVVCAVVRPECTARIQSCFVCSDGAWKKYVRSLVVTWKPPSLDHAATDSTTKLFFSAWLWDSWKRPPTTLARRATAAVTAGTPETDVRTRAEWVQPPPRQMGGDGACGTHASREHGRVRKRTFYLTRASSLPSGRVRDDAVDGRPHLGQVYVHDVAVEHAVALLQSRQALPLLHEVALAPHADVRAPTCRENVCACECVRERAMHEQPSR